MSQASARTKARALKKIMLKHGVPEVSIELRQGRPTSHGTWDAGFFVADMSHHIVSRLGANRTPGLWLVKHGRSDLEGPLCNGYGGFDLCYRIITFGYANHSGYGGPITVPALTVGKFTIPRDSGRRYTWGTEFEGGLNESDWDKVLTNPRNGKKMTFREFMGRCNAALEEFLEIHQNAHLEHSTWTSRKIDRLGYTKWTGIREKKPFRNPVRKRRLRRSPAISLSVVRSEFRKAHGIDRGKVKSTYHVGRLQRALNDKYDAGLKITRRPDKATRQAWIEHERRVGVHGRPAIPDAATLGVLSNRFRVKK